uniref:Uncharacterized protein n=1 Tax=Candidatus Kentrum sp. LFY TaxID=2126342 RepID=A0A450UUH6_9GAMM|nr:MAG: hypothetical protein BECKLFY1418A_GA0070994_10566 [Candidatus Kentron sp. LFY]
MGETVKYGTIFVKNGFAHWSGDSSVQFEVCESGSEFCELEGIWNPNNDVIHNKYFNAITGLCIWAKYDCVFKFEPRGKGNPGAVRSLISTEHQKNLFRRLKNGHKIEKILISETPYGQYQSQLIGWQADSVKRFGIKKLWYALPFDEYMVTIKELERFLPPKCVHQISHKLHIHYNMLKEKIKNTIDAQLEFIHPMRLDNISVEESYMWPYQNLEADLGIEEIQEIRIPYQTMKTGSMIPPILLGLLGMPVPYYSPREETSYDCLIP